MRHTNSSGIWEKTNHLISTRRLDFVKINKKKRNCWIVDFAVPVDHRVKLKENEKGDKYLDLARKLKKTVEHESDDDTNYDWCSWYCHQRIGKGNGGLGNRTSRDHPNYGIIKIGQNIIKSLVDLGRFVVIQTLVKNYRLTLVWETRKGVNNNNNNKSTSTLLGNWKDYGTWRWQLYQL